MAKLRPLGHLGQGEETQQTTQPRLIVVLPVVLLEMATLEAMVAVLEPQFAMLQLILAVLVVVVVQEDLDQRLL
jgi:hypothetical protein